METINNPLKRMTKQISVTLTPEESQALKQLIDIATKAQGLGVAEAAFHLFKRIIEAEKALEKTELKEAYIAACGECDSCEDCEPCEEACEEECCPEDDYRPYDDDSRSERLRREVQRRREV